MSLTKFPNGISSFGIPQVGPGAQIPVTFTGTYFYVRSTTGNSGNAGTAPDAPLATIQQAINKCTASAGDVIVVLPGHAESVVAASGITVNKIGVTIVGVGFGTLRPTVSLTTATSASIVVSAANVTIKNIVFSAGLASIVTVFTVTGNEFRLEGCDFVDQSASLNFINIVKTGTSANTSDGLTIIGNRVFSLGAGYLQFVLLGVSSDRFTYANNDVTTLSTSTVGSNVNIATFNITNAIVTGNTYANGGSADITTGIMVVGAGTASSGTICDNRIGGIITTPLLCATTLTMAKNQNYSQKTTTSNGILNPAGA